MTKRKKTNKQTNNRKRADLETIWLSLLHQEIDKAGTLTSLILKQDNEEDNSVFVLKIYLCLEVL